MEVTGKTSLLPRDVRNVLSQIDGKATVGDVHQKLDRLSEPKLMDAMSRLLRENFVREFVTAPVSVSPPSQVPIVQEDVDLDFTELLQQSGPGRGTPDAAEVEAVARQVAAAREREQADAKARAETDANVRAQAEARARRDAEQKAKAEAEAKARAAAEAKAKAEADARARAAAEQKAKLEAEARKRQESEERARKQAEDKARREAEEKAKREAEERARREAEDQARREAEAKAKREADEKVRREREAREKEEAAARAKREKEEALRRELEEEVRRAGARAQRESEEKAKREADERARREAEDKARREREAREKAEAEAKLKREAEEKARREAEEKAKREAEEKARRESEERAKREAEEKARREAEEKAKRQAEEAARRESEAREQAEAEARIRRELQEEIDRVSQGPSKAELLELEKREAAEAARRADEERTRREAEETAKREAEARARQEADAKAQREAEERARREAEERSRTEADQRARREAEEKERARREAEARAKAEADAKAKEEAEARARQEAEARAKEQADARARRELEEKARQELDRRARDEERARAKAEAEAAAQARKEERAREKAEAEAREVADTARIAEPAARRRRSGSGLGKLVGMGLFAALAAGAVALQFMPLDAAFYEKLASERFGAPVKIQSASFSLLPSPAVKFDNVLVGADQAMRIATVRAQPDIGSMLGDERTFRTVEISGVTVSPAGLGAVLWSKPAAGRLAIERIVGHDVRLALPGLDLPPLEVNATLGADGAAQRITLASVDKKISAEVKPSPGKASIEAAIASLRVPFGSTLVIADFGAKGEVTPGELTLTEFDGRMWDGVIKGRAKLRWSGGWSLDGDVDLKQADATQLVPQLFGAGRMLAQATFAMSAPTPDKLFESARADGAFTVQKGQLANIDFARMLQTGASKDGATLFNDLTGQVQSEPGRVALRNLRLGAGVLSATGAVDVEAGKSVTGKIAAEMKSPQGGMSRASFAVTGALPQLTFRR